MWASLVLLASAALAAPVSTTNETMAGNTTMSSNSTGSANQTGTSLTTPLFVSVPRNLTLNGTQIFGNNPTQFVNKSMAAPYTPAGGDQQTNPVYRTVSNFDFQSLNLALNQELIELDLFNNGLAKFSVEDFEAAGLNAADRSLIAFMANQEIAHAEALTNILGGDRSAKACTYQYPYQTVQEFVLFCQLLTRFGESGVYGFLPHLDSRPSAQILLQSITTEARQQLIFRQFQGLPPFPVDFETGIPQSYAWTLLSPYIKSCPKNNPRIQFQNFPQLNITNQPYALGGVPAIATNRSLTAPGRRIDLTWDAPGKTVGYDNLYNTSTVAGTPTHVAFISQLNVTYAPLQNITGRSAYVIQPNGTVFPGLAPIINGTMFISLVDKPLYLTPYNLTLINNHTVAGPALYQSG